MNRLLRPLCDVRAVSTDPLGTFEGHGSVFGAVDAYGDVIAQGAFKKTLKTWKSERGKFPPMLLQHGGAFSAGADDLVPIGVWDDMREDDAGLYVKGRLLSLDTDRGKRVHAAMLAGALDGLSIGFVTRDVSYGKTPEEPTRTLKAVELWEVSVVTFPANGDARVTQVKSGVDQTEREFEEWLVRSGGFSRRQAKAVVADGFRGLRRDAEPPPRDAARLTSTEAQGLIQQYYATT